MSGKTEANVISPVEQAVCRVAGQVLGLDKVLLSSDFFDIGGSSLSAAVFTEQLEDVFGMRVPMSLLYERPVLSDFAGALSQSMHRERP
jgi:acyl carrier protein